LACTIDETRHKANGKQPEQVACPQGVVFFLIVRSDQEKAIKNPFAPFAP